MLACSPALLSLATLLHTHIGQYEHTHVGHLISTRKWALLARSLDLEEAAVHRLLWKDAQGISPEF